MSRCPTSVVVNTEKERKEKHQECVCVGAGDGKLKGINNRQVILRITSPVIWKLYQSKVHSERKLLFGEERWLIWGTYFDSFVLLNLILSWINEKNNRETFDAKIIIAYLLPNNNKTHILKELVKRLERRICSIITSCPQQACERYTLGDYPCNFIHSGTRTKATVFSSTSLKHHSWREISL